MLIIKAAFLLRHFYMQIQKCVSASSGQKINKAMAKYYQRENLNCKYVFFTLHQKEQG